MAKVHDPKTDAQIHYGRREKLRQNFMKHGLSTFNEVQVLEYALGLTIPRIDTNPTAHRLIDKFGSLNGVINAHPSKLVTVPGVGESSACFLHFLKEFVTYSMATSKKNKKILTPRDATEYLRDVMKTYPTEHFVVLCLDKTGAIILRENIRGSIDKVDINLREISDTIFRVHSASVIFAHNHLDGNPHPSDADVQLTRALVNILFPNGINILDHIIFADEKEYSFATSGILPIFHREFNAFITSKDYEDILVATQNYGTSDN